MMSLFSEGRKAAS